MTDEIKDHKMLYTHLRSFLRRDLVSSGCPNRLAGAILNWFDPAKDEYLDHVDIWQKSLCSHENVGVPFLAKGTLWHYPWRFLAQIHQVAKLVYKWHGEPVRETDWSEVKNRLSTPLPITLSDHEVAGIRRILSGFCPPDLNEVVGRFGPGATAEGFDEFGKWIRKGFTPDVPPNLFRCSLRDNWAPRGICRNPTTKIAEVPKSIKCNRIVSSEPAMFMFAQLGVADALAVQLHRIFDGHVSLHDQNRHNSLLHLPDMATLDLSDASDHVSVELVQRVLPQLWPVLAKVRSNASVFPDGEEVELSTFAPMGSGLCFVVMTIVICGIIAYAYQSLNYNWRLEPWSDYGDDSIVGAFISDYVCLLFEKAGLVPNMNKSCFTGEYLESCGLELLRQHDVTPGYIRDPLSSVSAEKIDQIVGILLRRGLDSTANEVYRLSEPFKRFKWNEDLQRIDVLCRTDSVRPKLRRLDGYAGLNRWYSTHTLQAAEINSEGIKLLPDGVCIGVWKKPAWRYKPASLFPNLLGSVVDFLWPILRPYT